jgi:hypothetical protein
MFSPSAKRARIIPQILLGMGLTTIGFGTNSASATAFFASPGLQSICTGESKLGARRYSLSTVNEHDVSCYFVVAAGSSTASQLPAPLSGSSRLQRRAHHASQLFQIRKQNSPKTVSPVASFIIYVEIAASTLIASPM